MTERFKRSDGFQMSESANAFVLGRLNIKLDAAKRHISVAEDPELDLELRKLCIWALRVLNKDSGGQEGNLAVSKLLSEFAISHRQNRDSVVVPLLASD